MDFSSTTLISFIITCLIIELTPGPNMAYLAVVSASYGRSAGFATVAGIASGLLVIGIVAALGVATLIENSPFAYQALRIAGVCYLFWLAWDGWQSKTEDASEKPENLTRNMKFFVRGLITNLLNPKAAVFYIAVLPTFLTSALPVRTETVSLTVVYVIIATAVHAVIAVLAGTAQSFLQDERRLLIVRRGFSVLLGMAALWFAWETTYPFKDQ